ncbi:MAG TPA: AIR synthase-related protein, partial [Xanthomonadales bacterium]|nr:AIR synthase-related protein [Xanthomonadales bacterium]
DLVYILGATNDELAGSEYFSINNETGNTVPKVNSGVNKKLYDAFYNAVQKNLIASSISIGHGGLGIALAKKAIGGGLGIDVSLKNLTGNVTRDDFALYSESQGRILLTIAPGNKNDFEAVMKGNKFREIGKITKEPIIKIKGLQGDDILKLKLDNAVKAYRRTFEGY